ncbi:cupin domain-containing protein [Bacillus sp. CGMCC 1.16607]|uniref:cupin domain-containing protein n=1 Tax=Bacillus sp. CGMCC 1.16607 TaxID=3351842 RepID=UPI00362F1F34
MKKKSLQEHLEYNENQFTKRIIFKHGESTVFVLNFMPGQKLPAHKHPGTNVFILILNGNGTFTIDGVETKAKEREVIHITSEEELAFHNTGAEPASLYVMLNKIPDERYAQNI